MSDTEHPTPPPAPGSAAIEAPKTDTPGETTAPATQAAPEATAGGAAPPNFDELRRKLMEQIAGIGEQVDSIQTKLSADLTQAATQARVAIEKELAQVKEQHPDTFARLHELRDVGEEGWGLLRTRLDRLAGDLEKAVGSFLTSVTDAVRRAPDGSSPAAQVAGADAGSVSSAGSTDVPPTADAAAAPAAATDAPAAAPAAAPASDDKPAQ